MRPHTITRPGPARQPRSHYRNRARQRVVTFILTILFLFVGCYLTPRSARKPNKNGSSSTPPHPVGVYTRAMTVEGMTGRGGPSCVLGGGQGEAHKFSPKPANCIIKHIPILSWFLLFYSLCFDRGRGPLVPTTRTKSELRNANSHFSPSLCCCT